MSDSDSDFDDEFIQKLRDKRIADIKRAHQKTEMKTPDNLFISGPNTFIMLKKGDQTIRLFGEWHGHEDNCNNVERLRGKRIYTIMDYLDKELDSSGKIDLYIEAPLIHLQDPDTLKKFYDEVETHKKLRPHEKVAYISQTRNNLKWCLNPADRHRCQYKNARIHSTDVRPFEIFGEMAKKLRFELTKSEWDVFKKQYATTIKSLSGINTCKKYIIYIMQFIFKSRPIRKQLHKSKIRESDFILALYKGCKKRDAIQWITQYNRWLNSQNPQKGWHTDQHLTNIVQEQISILHDIYTFLRMIKPMDGMLQKNVIFYGGLAHVETLVVMLEQVGFKIVKTGTNVATRCVEI